MPSPGWKKILLEGDVAVLSDTAPADVDHAAASAGTAGDASRQDHKHDVDEGVVGTLVAIDGGATSLGTDDALPHLDHRHALGPLVADLDFSEQEADALSLEARADLPGVVTTKAGRIGFYTFDNHPYVYSPGA